MTLERYMATRRYWEVAGVVVLLSIGFLASVGVAAIDQRDHQAAESLWEVVTGEATSHIAVAIAILPLLLFDRVFPIRLDNWKHSVPVTCQRARKIRAQPMSSIAS